MNRPMKFLRIAIACAAIAVPGAASLIPVEALAAPARAPEIDQAVAALRAIATLRADFVQTDRNGQTISGVMTLKRPGRIRFQYQKDVPLLIVSDGRALTVIDYEVAQVQRWPIRNSPLGALLDPNRDVAAFAHLLPSALAGGFSVEIRDPKHPEYGVITMTFVHKASAPGGLELAGWVSLDSQNKRTAIRLSNQKYGIAVPDSTFQWRDPRPAVHR